MKEVVKLTRREFLRLTGIAGSGLILGIVLPEPIRAISHKHTNRSFTPNVFIQIAPDDTTTIVVAKSEMGQGVRTALPMIIMEELDGDWSRLKIVQADSALDNRYGRQVTGGSTSVRTTWERLRRAGAVARFLLLTAAAKKWGVDPASCRTERGWVVHERSGRRISYGKLTSLASKIKMPDPETIPLKNESTFRLLGTSPRRIDVEDIVYGRAMYGMDVRLKNMMFATVIQCPYFGGKLRHLDDSEAKKIDGVHKIIRLPRMEKPEYMEESVAVVAETTWSAFRGAEELRIEWEQKEDEQNDSDHIRRELETALEHPGEVVRTDGDVDRMLQTSSRIVEARYAFPYLAHAPMEPMNCTASVHDTVCEIWAPTQNPQRLQQSVAEALGFSPESVTVHVTLLGGGFGRRLFQDFAVQAALISRAVQAPVQLVWTREEDIQHDFYRPSVTHYFRAGLDKQGRPVAWLHRVASSGRDGVVRQGFPAGIIPHYRLEYTVLSTNIPWGWWRAVVYTHHTCAVQCFLDELAEKAGRDPVTYRLELLRKAPQNLPYDAHRLARVLERAAELAKWNRKRKNRALGIAGEYCFGSYIANVAEVSLEEGNRVRVHRVWVAVDPGVIVHPDMIRMQMESGIAFGLTAAFYGEITIENGKVQQSNLHDYPLLRFDEMPEVEVDVLSSGKAPGGIGEVGVPCIAPAVLNALAVLIGKRIRSLPLRLPSTRTRAS